MKIAVIGSRDFNNYDLLHDVLDNYLFITDDDNEKFYENSYTTVIISGGAKGADTLAEKYAEEHGLKTLIFKPDWNKYGKQAGFIRNKEIIKNADIVFAFWNYESKGTKHSIDLAKEQGKELHIIDIRSKIFNIYTSYYAKINEIKNNFKNYCLISISRYLIKGLEEAVNFKIEIFEPETSLLNDFKNNKINREQYKEIYLKNLSNRINTKNIDNLFNKLKKDYENVFLLCYEKSENFCHRHLLREYLNNNYNLNIREF